MLEQAASENASPRRRQLVSLGDCNTCALPDGLGGAALVDLVAAQLEAAGRNCETVNLAQTMTTTREGRARVRHLDRGADVALINYGLVDSWVTSLPAMYVPYYPDSRAKRFFRKLLKDVKRRLRSEGVRRWIPTGAVVSLDEYERNLRHMIGGLKRDNPAVVIVLWSTMRVLDNSSRSSDIAGYNARMLRIAWECGCLFIDTESVLRNLPDADAYRDAVHLSRTALDRLAAAMAVEILHRLATEPVGRSQPRAA